MNRFSSVSLASAFASAVVALSPFAANAQTAPTGPYTAEQLRAQYVAHGYQADAPVSWWTPNNVTTFRVSDPANGRVVMVLVYPDSATADADRSAAQARDTNAEGNGPHLVEGYGFSTWRDNVALVESTTDTLARQYAAQQASDNQVSAGIPATVEASDVTPTFAVDLDMIGIIDSNTVNL
jgi:hypothetical protein